MTSALAMHDHLLRLLLHQHCGYEVKACLAVGQYYMLWNIEDSQLLIGHMHEGSVHEPLSTLLTCLSKLRLVGRSQHIVSLPRCDNMH